MIFKTSSQVLPRPESSEKSWPLGTPMLKILQKCTRSFTYSTQLLCLEGVKLLHSCWKQEDKLWKTRVMSSISPTHGFTRLHLANVARLETHKLSPQKAPPQSLPTSCRGTKPSLKFAMLKLRAFIVEGR